MAASLASIAETWPENVLPPIGSRKSLARKIIARPFPLYGFIRFIGFYCLTKQIICVNLCNLCAFIWTRIRVIRAECGEETHSASLSTHQSPLNPDYP